MIDSIPVVAFTAPSIMLVILASMISGLAPSSVVVTDKIGNSIIGNLSSPIFCMLMMPNRTKIPDIIHANTCLRIDISGNVILGRVTY